MKNEKSEAAWAGLMEEYFFKTPLRKASEWSYAKVLKGFRQFVGGRRYAGEHYPAGCSALAEVCFAGKKPVLTYLE
ncbi:Uncharacterised protein [Cedecea neteri]|uniref:Uncharacterized protein n=1 Tax=Cedecea neteri TaxID=158822 RepID=A0A2X2T782_9ENTR|nr:Uncharacterised protein [Cedecea neteri]